MALNTQPKTMVSAQFPQALAEQLAELAQANERSLSAEMRVAAAEHVEREAGER